MYYSNNYLFLNAGINSKFKKFNLQKSATKKQFRSNFWIFIQKRITIIQITSPSCLSFLFFDYSVLIVFFLTF